MYCRFFIVLRYSMSVSKLEIVLVLDTLCNLSCPFILHGFQFANLCLCIVHLTLRVEGTQRDIYS